MKNYRDSCHFTRTTKNLLWVGRKKMKEKVLYIYQKSFNHKRYSHKTTLSSYACHLKETLDVTSNLKWSVSRCATPLSNVSKKCRLCLYGKLFIITYPRQHELLNKRLELFWKCRHDNKCLFKYFRVNDKYIYIYIYIYI